MSEDTTLADLLSLNLHNFEDEVHNIVDKACKEMAMESMLKVLAVAWKTLEFHYEDHVTGYKLLRASEEAQCIGMRGEEHNFVLLTIIQHMIHFCNA